MRLAYADPPYPGQGHRYPEKTEVDHAELIARLEADYDGWALSTNSSTLAYVLGLCPDGVRIAAWVKTWAVWKPGVNPAYAWEPVVFHGGRRRTDPNKHHTIRDWWQGSTLPVRGGVVGAKPYGFCQWVLQLLGYEDGDEVEDLYPGTGALSRALAQGRLL